MERLELPRPRLEKPQQLAIGLMGIACFIAAAQILTNAYAANPAAVEGLNWLHGAVDKIKGFVESTPIVGLGALALAAIGLAKSSFPVQEPFKGVKYIPTRFAEKVGSLFGLEFPTCYRETGSRNKGGIYLARRVFYSTINTPTNEAQMDFQTREFALRIEQGSDKVINVKVGGYGTFQVKGEKIAERAFRLTGTGRKPLEVAQNNVDDLIASDLPGAVLADANVRQAVENYDGKKLSVIFNEALRRDIDRDDGKLPANANVTLTIAPSDGVVAAYQELQQQRVQAKEQKELLDNGGLYSLSLINLMDAAVQNLQIQPVYDASGMKALVQELHNLRGGDNNILSISPGDSPTGGQDLFPTDHSRINPVQAAVTADMVQKSAQAAGDVTKRALMRRRLTAKR